jgi:superfamily I DNA and/or RNA helicase
LFDIVIYDEASQIPIEYTLPSLYRAKRFVVAGDEKQLPPTDFFKASFDEDEEIDDINVKSLLELCKGKCPAVLLSFHYRSKYEELIEFSNYAFYNGKIAVSPNKETGCPFEFIRVNGIWENRKNYKESETVVEKVYELLKEDHKKSIGIITFNAEQRDLIYEMLDKKSLEDEEFRKLYEKSLNLKKDGEDLGLFVRNIENVQGDERDIIIFSIGYARDKDGKLRYNFGPLNKAGGENRLNVAITRAKEKIIIVSSIDPEELNVENTQNEGPKLFKRYLQYAKAIANNDKVNAEIILDTLCKINEVKRLYFDSPFEEEVYNELIKRGYIVDTQVGCSRYRIDLAIKHPKEDKYILGIECDGATYHSSRSAKERDLYRQKFLEMKGWKIIRIWSRNWWKNKEKEIERIEKEVKRILS